MKLNRAILLALGGLVFVLGAENPLLAQFTLVTVGHATNKPPATTYANDVVVKGNYAYVSYEPIGVRIYDISDPTRILAAGTVSNGVSPEGLAVSGNYLYVPDYYNGLHVYDISDPTNAVQLAVTNNGGHPFSVAVSDNYLFLMNGIGVRIYDISDPANLFSVGYTNTSGSQNIALSGNYAFLANGNGGLQVYDFSDPTHLVAVGHSNDGNAHCVAVSGNLAYVLYTAGGGLAIYDISDPANPQRLSRTGGSASPYDFHGLVVSGNFVYAAMSDGVRVFDVSDPANPQEVGFATVPNNFYGASGIALFGDAICVANQADGLRIYKLFGPRLDIAAGPSISVSWISNYLGFVLQQNASLGPIGWEDVTNLPMTTSNRTQVLLAPTPTNAFFRLGLPAAPAP